MTEKELAKLAKRRRDSEAALRAAVDEAAAEGFGVRQIGRATGLDATTITRWLRGWSNVPPD